MRKLLTIIFLLGLTACAPSTPQLQLPQDCRAEFGAAQLLAGHWLLQNTTWRLRQTALLEIGPRKMAMEGFLQLDLTNRTARLLALNELGLVLFDLEVTDNDEVLHRALPQLQKIDRLAQGVGRSIRQIFLLPHPENGDQPGQQGTSQLLTRQDGIGRIDFLFDCNGDLRQTRSDNATSNWRIIYNQYREYGMTRLPEEIVLNDYRHDIKLSLNINEVKQVP